MLRNTIFAALSAAAAVAACSGAPSQEATTTSGAGTGGSSSAQGNSAASTGGAATTGAGTGGGMKPFMPGAQPQVINLGGTVLATPKVQPIAYMNDPNGADLDKFLQELTKTSYWSDTTSEYGVGPLMVLPTIVLMSAAPASPTRADVEQLLTTNLTGATPAWGMPDGSTIYLFLFPPGTIVNDSGLCCTDFDGFHAEGSLTNTTSVPYAITCACPGFDGSNVDALQQRTVVVSHELVEAATDPFVDSNPAYAQTDDPDFVWTLVTAGEVADMCALNSDSYLIPTGATYMIQRSWSNAAAKKLANPCVPLAANAPTYFNSFPALPDTITFQAGNGTAKTHGVKIPVGQTRTIDVNLWSTGPKKLWHVTAMDYENYVTGATPNLKLALDKPIGSSGETLKLTITVVSADPNFGAEAFILFSDYGVNETLAMGLVGQ
jgi:hypothetical protein